MNFETLILSVRGFTMVYIETSPRFLDPSSMYYKTVLHNKLEYDS